jgi:hypothetical protein
MYFGEYQIQRKFKSIDLNFIAGTTGNVSYILLLGYMYQVGSQIIKLSIHLLTFN